MMPLAATVKDLVTRARLGDQNAMGMIAAVAETAAKKDAPFRAILAQKMLAEYIKRNPGSPKITFGDEPTTVTRFPKALLRGIVQPTYFMQCFSKLQSVTSGALIACVALANGPPLTNQRLAAFGERIRAVQVTGVKPSEAISIVDRARRMQAIRNRKEPLSTLSSAVAWELD